MLSAPNSIPFLVATVIVFLLNRMVIADSHQGPRQPTYCQEPAHVMKMQRWLRNDVLHHSHISYSAIQRRPSVNVSVSFQDVKVASIDSSRCDQSNGRTCSCPHKYDVNFDPNRIPRVLVQASCCYSNQRHTGEWQVGCRDVIHHIPVLRRVRCDERGIYQYQQVWERIPVGCSCFTEWLTPGHQRRHR